MAALQNTAALSVAGLYTVAVSDCCPSGTDGLFSCTTYAKRARREIKYLSFWLEYLHKWIDVLLTIMLQKNVLERVCTGKFLKGSPNSSRPFAVCFPTFSFVENIGEL